MAASSSELQAQQDALEEQLPVLSLNAAPRQLSCADVLAYAAAAGGKPERQEAAHLIAKAAASARVTACEICDRQGQPSTSATHAEDEEDENGPAALRFCAATSLQFAARRLRVIRGSFLCSRCRAACNPMVLLSLFVPPLQGADDEETESVLQQHLLHLAAVNGAPAGLTGNPVALSAWGLRLANRAASLRIVAGGVRGWALELPGGKQLAPLAKGSGVELARALLAARAAAGGGGGGKKQKKRKQQQQEGEAQQQRRDEGARERLSGLKKRRKSGDASAEAADAAASTPARAPTGQRAGAGGGKTPKPQPATPKPAAGRVGPALGTRERGEASPATGKKERRGTPAAGAAAAAAAGTEAQPLSSKKRKHQAEQGGVGGAAAPKTPQSGKKVPEGAGGKARPPSAGGTGAGERPKKQQGGGSVGVKGAVGDGSSVGRKHKAGAAGAAKALLTPQPKAKPAAGKQRRSM